jgi:hypothetical protein
MSSYVNFTFQSLKEEVGKNKTNKKILGMPAWKDITRENHKNYIKKEHKGHAILTGKMSGITVFDFDIPEVYYKFIELYPKLKTYKTIKTKNGFHVYCDYDEDIKTTTDGFVHDKGVDIRNDDAIVFAPPCQRVLLDGNIFTYEDLGGDILPVPEIFIDNMKQLEDTTDGDSIVSNEIVSSISICAADVKYIQEAIEKGWLNDMANASYDEWRNVGFAIKHTLGDQGRQLFHQFSKINEKYDNEYTDKFWDTIKQGKKPLTLGSIKYWVRQYKEKHEFGNIVGVESDNEAAEIILDRLKDVLFFSNGQIFFKIENVWIFESDKIEAYLVNYILTSNIKKKTTNFNGDTIMLVYCENVTSAKNIFKALIYKIKTKNVNIYEKFHTTTKNRICFMDGVLDFNVKKFYKWNEIDFEYYTTTMIHRNFSDYFNNPNRDIMKKVNDDVFAILFGNDIETAFQFLSRGITANIEDKNWATYLGNRNCGKGVLFDLLQRAFEKYISTFELSNLLCQRQTDISEVSRKLYWLIDLQFVRLGISQETPKESTGLKLNGKMMKKLAGGGDEMVARRNYDRIDTHFKIDTTFLIMGNDYLEVDVNDTNEHRIEFNSIVSFKSEEEIECMKKDGFDDLILSTYKVKNDDIKTLCKTDEYANALVMLLFEKWTNKSIVAKKNVDEQEDSLRKKILNLYEITKKGTDYVTIDDIIAVLGEGKKKISNELENMGLNKKKITAKIDRNKWAFYGIKLKIVTEE